MRTQQTLATTVAALLAAGAMAFPSQSSPYTGEVQRSHPNRGRRAADGKGVFMMNRIAPATSELYVANADGTGETLLLGDNSAFDYHAAWSPDGQYVTFTSERNGDGQSDIFRAKADGSGVEEVLATASFEDKLVLSPDGTQGAYVSTANGYTTNIWVIDLATGATRNLTDTEATRTDVSNDESPRGHFNPAWSPDGQWIAFSSDRETAWLGHSNGSAWEHTQSLSIYAIKPDGTGFRQVATNGSDMSLGEPKWSPDGKRIIYYAIAREDTYNAHTSFGTNGISTWIESVDFETGSDVQLHVADDSVIRVNPQWIGQSSTVGYLNKGTAMPGINYTSYATGQAFIDVSNEDVYYRSVSWSPDGTKILYEKQNWSPVREEEKPLYSWDDQWEYRFTDVFPTLSPDGSRFAITQKQLGNSSIVTYSTNGEDIKLVLNAADYVPSQNLGSGTAGCFQPDWSPDGEYIVVGVGFFFKTRSTSAARLMRVRADGTEPEYLTDGTYNAGFPSFNHDGTKVVFRAWSFTTDEWLGLKVVDLTNGNTVTDLTSEWDNLPHYNPDGSDRIVLTRRTSCCTEQASNYDIVVMNGDGSNVTVVTSSGANEAHAVWNWDGSKILYSSGEFGFRDESTLYDDTFQPYGQIMSMNPDGSDKKMLIDTMWEDSMPMQIPSQYLA